MEVKNTKNTLSFNAKDFFVFTVEAFHPPLKIWILNFRRKEIFQKCKLCHYKWKKKSFIKVAYFTMMSFQMTFYWLPVYWYALKSNQFWRISRHKWMLIFMKFHAIVPEKKIITKCVSYIDQPTNMQTGIFQT